MYIWKLNVIKIAFQTIDDKIECFKNGVEMI